MLSCVLCLVTQLWLFATPWTVACQSPLSMGILKGRILEWVAMPSSRGYSQPRDQTQVSCITGGFFTIWAIKGAQEYWSAYPIPSTGYLPHPGIKLVSPALQADSLPAEWDNWILFFNSILTLIVWDWNTGLSKSPFWNEYSKEFLPEFLSLLFLNLEIVTTWIDSVRKIRWLI